MDVKTNTVCYYCECCLQALCFTALPVISRARVSYALLAKSGPSHNETFAQSISCNMYKAPHEKKRLYLFSLPLSSYALHRMLFCDTGHCSCYLKPLYLAARIRNIYIPVHPCFSSLPCGNHFILTIFLSFFYCLKRH